MRAFFAEPHAHLRYERPREIKHKRTDSAVLARPPLFPWPGICVLICRVCNEQKDLARAKDYFDGNGRPRGKELGERRLLCVVKSRRKIAVAPSRRAELVPQCLLALHALVLIAKQPNHSDLDF